MRTQCSERYKCKGRGFEPSKTGLSPPLIFFQGGISVVHIYNEGTHRGTYKRFVEGLAVRLIRASFLVSMHLKKVRINSDREK